MPTHVRERLSRYARKACEYRGAGRFAMSEAYIEAGLRLQEEYRTRTTVRVVRELR